MKVLVLQTTKIFFPIFMSLLVLFSSMASAKTLYCPDAKVHLVGTPMTARQARRMLAEAEFKEHRKMTREEKVNRVIGHISTSHNGLPDITKKELAEVIVDIADCTGNDFAIFAGLLKKESDYCLKRLNQTSVNSSASGCGQITVWPVR